MDCEHDAREGGGLVASIAAAIKATLGLDTKPLDAGLARANSSVATFGGRIKSLMGGIGGSLKLGGIGLAIGTLVSAVRNIGNLAEPIKESEEAIRAMRREAAGLSAEEAKAAVEIGHEFKRVWTNALDATSGGIAKVIIGLRNLTTGGKFLDAFTGQDKPATIGLSQDEQAQLNKRKGEIEKRQKEEARKKVEAEAKAAEEITAKVLDEQDKQEAARSDAEFKLADVAGKRAILEREITELRAKQKTDDLLVREQARTKELEKQRDLRQLQVDELLKPREQKREEARQQAKLERAERVIDARQRDAADRAKRNGRQLPARDGVGELQGPPAPATQAVASEATLKDAVAKLSVIAANLGVRL
jgi:hypothetical protein